MNSPLVSIITPCYNGEKFINRFLDSVLNQTYGNIELIFINDGSTDNSEQLVLNYKKKFETKGYSLIYIYQNNKGLSGAINAGLRAFSGEYLCWPDIDDYLENTSIEKRVAILKEHPEYAVVTSDAYIRESENINTTIGLISAEYPKRFDENQFELLLNEESIFCSGCHMVRSDVFLNTHPDRLIFEARRGQNWQMLLPIYYKHRRYFLDEPLYNYIINNSSMSQGDNTKKKKLCRCDEHQEILTNTIISMKMNPIEKEKYLNLIHERYMRKRFHIAQEYKDRQLIKEQYSLLRNRNKLTKIDKIVYFRAKYEAVNFIFRFITFIKRVSKTNKSVIGKLFKLVKSKIS